MNPLKIDYIKSVDYLSCGNSTQYQACVAKVCKAHFPVAQHQSQDDLDNLLDWADTGGGRLTHSCADISTELFQKLICK